MSAIGGSFLPLNTGDNTSEDQAAQERPPLPEKPPGLNTPPPGVFNDGSIAEAHTGEEGKFHMTIGAVLVRIRELGCGEHVPEEPL